MNTTYAYKDIDVKTTTELKSTMEDIRELINEKIIPATDLNKVNIEHLETSFRNYIEQTEEEIEDLVQKNNRISKMLKIVTIVAGCISLLLGGGILYLFLR